VTLANGNPTSFTTEKRVYFFISLFTNPSPNDIGKVILSDQPRETRVTRQYEEKFRVFSAKLNSDGTYDYWAIDIGNDGQTVLFEVDNNSVVPTVTVSRYSPGVNGKVLKRTIYYID
jgi:hypothetical protein